MILIQNEYETSIKIFILKFFDCFTKKEISLKGFIRYLLIKKVIDILF